MKLLSIDLTDIRRFTTPVRIAAIGPGLNVLSAPNESGKSTLFDALQALFFQPHRSKGKEVMSLRPHVGGGPTIAVELDLPDGRHRIEKRWLSKPMATVHRDGRLIAQADEAEAFIARLVHSDADGGPAGLLWVRQGLTRLESENPRERDAAKEARRSLLTSVTGEVDALTGGRRMDRALARTREDLARYLTATGRPAKDGPLAQALAEVDALTLRQTALQTTATQLDRALSRRRDVLRLLSDLTAPEAIATRQSRLDEATQRRDAALRHAEHLSSAAAALQGADLHLASLTEKLATLHRAKADHARSLAQQIESQSRASAARGLADQADAALAPLAATLSAAQAARSTAEATYADALRAEAAQSAIARHADLTRRLTEARELSTRRTPLARAAATGPTRQDIAALDSLSQEAQVQRALRDRSAPQITFHHDGPTRATLEGQPVPDGPLPILAQSRFTLPGLGHLTVTPGAAADHTALDRAEAALTAALMRLGTPDLATARTQSAARTEAAAALANLDRALASLAPTGLATLEADLAALPPETPARADLPSVADAQALAQTAAAALAQAQTALDAARTEAQTLRRAEIRATVEAEAADTALRQAEATLAAFGDLATAETTLTAQLAQASSTRDAALAAHGRLSETAPDLAATEAAFTRARAVVDTARTEIQSLETERAALDKEITIHSGEGVMEELADTTARLAAARETLALLQFEVATLQELARALETARDEARDRYFAPVLAELRPLLRVLWPDAELRFDGESLLPTALIRDGQDEDLSILSGGTQEQVALLVRLAFARLLARRGQHAPVIFDDALVYTDDDRIEKLFDALHAQAQDQQIIVLSCRQRAFRDLGGAALSFQPFTD
jgi:DNA repair exonuclease SbcCD ATPase subunit